MDGINQIVNKFLPIVSLFLILIGILSPSILLIIIGLIIFFNWRDTQKDLRTYGKDYVKQKVKFEKLQISNFKKKRRKSYKTNQSYKSLDPNKELGLKGKRVHSTVGNCICGCEGISMSDLPEYSIDYFKYKTCPARWRRKYFKADLKIQKRKEEQYLKAEEKRILREKNKLKELKKLDEAKQKRIINGLPALSKTEAVERGLTTFIGKKCINGHNGERLTRNGQCIICRESDNKLRDAMKRGAYPRDLSESEKESILSIYAKARKLTKETGIQYHVDHIKPLSKGGEHHPDNLQILTAEENISKSNKWKEEDN